MTGEGWHDTPDFVKAIADQVVRVQQRLTAPPPNVEPKPSKADRTILMILSERGFWGEELIGPMEVFEANGYTLKFATPRGRRPRALPPSMDATYIDPPLGRSVVSEEMAQKVRAMDGSPKLDNPIDLSAWLPERPYWSAPMFVRAMEAYNWALERVYDQLRREYAAMLIVGGSGPVVDLVNNQRVHDLILGFYRLGRPIGAECYGVPCLAFARDISDRKSLLWGKHVTGHCLEYDYKDGTGFLGDDVSNFNMGPPPYPLEYILRDATGPDGAYHGNFGRPTSVIVDFPFVTGRSTPDSYLTGQKMVEVLEEGLLQWGWKAPVYAASVPIPSRAD